MVAPYSPTQEDYEKMFIGLPPININCERFKKQFQLLLKTLIISAFFYVLAKSSLTRSFVCN